MADVAAIEWAAGPALPGPRNGAVGAPLPDGTVILIGGRGRVGISTCALVFPTRHPPYKTAIRV